MARKPRIAIVGAGKVGGALAVSLRRAGYSIDAIVTRPGGFSFRRASRLARQVGSRAVISGARIKAEVIWFCVPDGEIASAAQSLALLIRGQPTVALHSSGLLSTASSPDAGVATVFGLQARSAANDDQRTNSTAPPAAMPKAPTSGAPITSSRRCSGKLLTDGCHG